jgi:putrescine transport system substrate-binding protein
VRLLATALLVLLPWTGGPVGAAEEPVLNVFNWADYVAPDTIENFEREFGIEVNYDLYDSTEVVEARLLSGSTGYDVVFHSVEYSARLIKVGVYQPLDRSRLGHVDALDPWVMDKLAMYDPGNRYAVPYMWGTTGFSYNVDMVRERMPDAPVDSAAMLFEPEVAARFADCGVTLTNEPTDVIPMVLSYLGYDPNSIDPEHLAAAERQLKRVRPFIRYFSSARMINDLPNREVCVAMSWSGDYQTAMQRAREVGSDVRLAYTVPKEGSALWFDGIFIPADAPHPGNAHRFIDYLMRPEVIARISNFTFYANANTEALPLLSADLRNDPSVLPALGDRSRLSVLRIFGPKEERLRTRVWARVKSGL